MRVARAVAALALVATGALGCEQAPAQVLPAGAPEIVCQGVPDQVCRDALDTTGAVRGSVVQLVVRCTAPVCTVAAGEAAVTITFVDGRQEMSSYGWAAAAPMPPGPIPVFTQAPLSVRPVCEGVPLDKCLEMAANGSNGASADTVTGITVHCDTTCTLSNGQGQTTYDYADGAPSTTASWVYGN